MTVRGYLWGMRFSALIASVSFALVLYYVNPFRDGWIAQVLFYVSLFFMITSILTIFLFWIRRKMSRNEIVFANVGISLRQAIILSLLLETMLFLVSQGYFLWWTALLAVVGALLIELWFLSK